MSARSMEAPGGRLHGELELDKVCRTCLRQEPNMKSVFIPEDAMEPCVTNMVSSCTSLKFEQGDGLPIHICRNCFNSVTNAFLFKMQAERADERLRSYIMIKGNDIINSSSIKEENVTDDIIIENVKMELDDDYAYDDNIENRSSRSIEDQTDDSDDAKTLKELKDISLKQILPKKKDDRQSMRSDFRRTLMCKLCDKTFKYINCLKKHLQNHIGFEPFISVDQKSIESLLECQEKISTDRRIDAVKQHGCKPDSISDDYILKLIIEDIKAGNFDQYIGEVKLNDNLLPRLNVVTNSIDEISISKNDPTDKKKKMINIKSKIKRGIKKVRKNKFHKCSICERMFSRSNHLIRHMSTHNYEYPDKCDICNKVFPNKDMLSKHNPLQCANTLKPFRCGTCDMKFADENTFNEHTAKRHKGESVSANFVQFEDIIAEKLEQFISKMKVDDKVLNTEFGSGNKLYACSACDLKFADETSFTEHSLEQHLGETTTYNIIQLDDIKGEKNDSYMSDMSNEQNDSASDDMDVDSTDDLDISNKRKKEYYLKSAVKRRKHKLHECSVCERTFTRSNHLMRHMSIHNYNYPDKCDICYKVFPNKVMLEKHSLIRCENAPKTFRCGTCDMKFENEIQFKDHIMKRHKGESVSVNFIDPLCQKKEKGFTCDECNKSFYRKDHLDKHIKIHIIKGKKFECHICLRKFKEKDNLISHSIVHELKKGLDSKYHCMYCDHSFSNTSNLIVHMRRHTGEKPFKCDLCDKGFPRSSDLNCHRRTHTGEKPCLCTICGKGFSRSNKLARHMRVHTGQRPYKCTYCPRAFTQSNDLTLHIRRHTGDRPYICTTCGDRFINGTALHAHRKAQRHYNQVVNQASQFSSLPLNLCDDSNDVISPPEVDIIIHTED